eukprot:1189034-Prorocentrum_minimum.AAC.2
MQVAARALALQVSRHLRASSVVQQTRTSQQVHSHNRSTYGTYKSKARSSTLAASAMASASDWRVLYFDAPTRCADASCKLYSIIHNRKP